MNNLIEWLVEHEYADNGFSAAGMANGLQLAGLPDEQIKARAALYRQWRPTHKSPVKSWQAFQLTVETPWLNPADYTDRQMDLFDVTDLLTEEQADAANKYAYDNQGTAV